MDSPENNKRIGDYELLDVLGSGSQGQVYKARCVVSGKDHVQEGDIVAIKILGRSGSASETEDARFKREARILEKLEHASICRYIDYFIDNEGEFDERQCLVTEFLDGQALDDRLTRYPKGLPWDEVFPIFEQCIEGLAYAAERDVFHRDLKPSNVYITREGHAKIIDFGIARQEGGEETTTGGFKGSFDYMAPDFVLVEGFRGDVQSDIFSLGVCFFKALTGSLPFEPLGENAHIGYLNRWKGSEGVRPSFRHNAFRVLTRVKPFVCDCLASDPEERFHTFEEMLEGLRTVKRRVVRHKGKEDYELLEMLGRGGFGEVYKGRATGSGDLVAIKHLFAGRQASRFVKEAKILQRYHHPDIVDYVDFIEVEGMGDDKEFFLVMEYLPGMPGAGLNQRIRRSRFGLEPAEVVEIFIHYLSALQFLHENPRPIIHRDIKPGNLYAPVGQPTKAKLFDLGVARDVSGTMTTGMIPGTLDYMAPEFARPGSERGTAQSDIFAMGVTLYEALTGKKPYPRLPKSDQEAFVQFVARSQNPPDVNYGMPVFREIPSLERILRMSLATEPTDRYGSAGAMLGDLETLLEEVSAEDVDLHDAPTRATIADPELIERLRAHQQQRPDRIPESEMQRILDDSSSKGDVQRRPDWMEEEASGSSMDLVAATPTPSVAATPASTVVPVARPRNSGLKLALVAVVLLVLGLGGFLMWRNMPASAEDIRTAFVKSRQELAEPDPSEAYVIRLLSLQAQAREKKLEDATYEVWWDNEITTISEYGPKIPQAFEGAFTQAIQARDLPAAEAVLQSWKKVGDSVSFMQLSQREYLTQSDSMRDRIGRFNFTVEVESLSGLLPERLGGATDVAAAEEAAITLRSLRSQPWDEVPAADKDQAFDEIEARLTALVEDFVTDSKDAVVSRYTDGQDAGAGADALTALETDSPTLVGLAQPAYREALVVVDDARRRYDRLQTVAATLARLNDAVPAAIGDPDDVGRAEQAVAAYQQEVLNEWEGIPPEDKLVSLNQVRDNLVDRITTHIEQLRTDALAKYEALDPDVPEDQALQDIGANAPRLVALLNGGYADAVQAVDEARRARDKTLLAQREEAAAAEAMALEQARLQREQEAEQARLAAMAANQTTFSNEVARLTAQLPETIGDAGSLASAETALRAVNVFAARDWADVPSADRDAAAARLRADLTARATSYVEALSAQAVQSFDAGEESVAAWTALGQTQTAAPTLVSLIDTTYDRSVLAAEEARRRQQGINEFTVALDGVRSRIPARIDSAENLARAEEAADAFRTIQGQPWDMVSETQRQAGLSQLEETLRRRATQYVTSLREQALEKYRRLEDGGAEEAMLTAVSTDAPTVAELLGALPAESLAAVQEAGLAMAQRQAYSAMLAALDADVPATLATASDLASAERAVLAHREAAGKTWEGIPEPEQQNALTQREMALRNLAQTYVDTVRQEALSAYAGQQDGRDAADRLTSLTTAAPSLTALVQTPFDAAAQEVATARDTWEAGNRFAQARGRILDALPETATGPEDMARLEAATQAFAQFQDAAWDEVPAAEKIRTFQDIRTRLSSTGSEFIAGLAQSAVARYDAMEDASDTLDTLRGFADQTPTLVALLGGSYAQAVQSVDTARGRRDTRLQEMEAERIRQEKMRQEQERLAALRTQEEEALARAQTAWDQIQAAWDEGDEADVDTASEAILTPTFQIEELAAAHQALKQAFTDALESRMTGYLQGAEQAIAGYRAYTYQILDPTFSGSYRVIEEDPPAVTFDLPAVDTGDDAGLSKAAMLRLQSWQASGGNLGTTSEARALADRLATIGAASRQQGDPESLELANQCRMENALLVSEPAVFPRALEEVGEPIEIFRWRAHANYQPEAPSQEILLDMERYATKGGTLNEYDLRLALFTSYYCFRNSIRGENAYVQRTGKLLGSILSQADPTVSGQVMDWLIEYIDGGTDQESEYPGLYLMTALSSIGSEADAARQAVTWLEQGSSRYVGRFRQIKQEIDLLNELLKG